MSTYGTSDRVGLIDNIDQCPMKAIYTNRIDIRTVDTNYTPGLTPQEKGTALHQALETIWQHIACRKAKESLETDHAALLAYRDGELSKLINIAVVDAIFWVNREDIEVQLIQSEIALLNITLKEWMQFEKDRTPFDILSTEEVNYVNLGEFRLKIVNDRLDRVTDNGNSQIKVAFDYKSTEKSISEAFSTNISSQLPLSALSMETKGVAYMNVVSNNPTISGVVAGGVSELTDIGSHRYKGPKNWEELKMVWLDKITALLTSYVGGQMKFTPSTQSCMYCVKKSLCAISVV